MPRSRRVSSSGSESYALSPIRRFGCSFRKALARVPSTRVTSCGEALCAWRARGEEEPSENAMSFVPLPRLVFPTHDPLFWLRRTCRLCNTPRGLSPRAFRGLRPTLRVRCQEPLPQSISESDDGRSLVGRVAFGEILPGCSGAKYPEDAVEDIARISPRPAPPILSLRWRWDQWLQYLPLLFGEVHALFHSCQKDVRQSHYSLASTFMRWLLVI